MQSHQRSSPSEGKWANGLSRRRFISVSAGLMAGAAFAEEKTAAKPEPDTAPSDDKLPLVGSQLYGWGQYYGREGKELHAHLDEVLPAIQDCGFDYAEGFLDSQRPENNERFAERLQIHGLKPVSLYTGGEFHTKDGAAKTVERLVAAARVCGAAGFSIIVCNPDPIGRDKTDEELNIQAAALEQFGRELGGLKMSLGMHQHTPELRQDGRELHSIFNQTPRDLVGFCMDVHWIFRGGLKPMDILKRYHSRLVSWHLRQSRDEIWWEDLDTGDIDYGAIAAFAKEKELTAPYTVELALEKETKITRSVVENHCRSRKFVREIFGV